MKSETIKRINDLCENLRTFLAEQSAAGFEFHELWTQCVKRESDSGPYIKRRGATPRTLIVVVGTESECLHTINEVKKVQAIRGDQ